MFFPTDPIETYRLLALLGEVKLDSFKRRYLKENVFSEEEYKDIFVKSADNNIRVESVIFDKWLKEKQYDLIKAYFTYSIGFKNEFPTTICDPFAGEARWLDIFKSFIPKDQYCNDIALIGNELEEIIRISSIKL